MHPDRGILRTYRRLDGISTRPDNHNTLTNQSSDTKNEPRDPLHFPVTWNPSQTRPYSILRLRLHLRLLLRPRASPPPLQPPQVLHLCVKRIFTVASGIRC